MRMQLAIFFLASHAACRRSPSQRRKLGLPAGILHAFAGYRPAVPIPARAAFDRADRSDLPGERLPPPVHPGGQRSIEHRPDLGAGTAIRPYGEWERPYRPGATPYGPWGNPQGPWTLPFQSWQNPFALNRLPSGYGSSPYGPGSPAAGVGQPGPQAQPVPTQQPFPPPPSPAPDRGGRNSEVVLQAQLPAGHFAAWLQE